MIDKLTLQTKEGFKEAVIIPIATKLRSLVTQGAQVHPAVYINEPDDLNLLLAIHLKELAFAKGFVKGMVSAAMNLGKPQEIAPVEMLLQEYDDPIFAENVHKCEKCFKSAARRLEELPIPFVKQSMQLMLEAYATGVTDVAGLTSQLVEMYSQFGGTVGISQCSGSYQGAGYALNWFSEGREKEFYKELMNDYYLLIGPNDGKTYHRDRDRSLF